VVSTTGERKYLTGRDPQVRRELTAERTPWNQAARSPGVRLAMAWQVRTAAKIGFKLGTRQQSSPSTVSEKPNRSPRRRRIGLGQQRQRAGASTPSHRSRSNVGGPGLANVPLFSCGRTIKAEVTGREDRARGTSPRATATTLLVTTTRGRQLQQLVGQLAIQRRPAQGRAADATSATALESRSTNHKARRSARPANEAATPPPAAWAPGRQ
jgi:hypothetical protein